jgi:hypothetical protein
VSQAQLIADVRALRHYLGELLPSVHYEGNSVIANVLSSIEGIAMKLSDGTIMSDLSEDGNKALQIIKEFLASRGIVSEDENFCAPQKWNDRYGTNSELVIQYDGSSLRRVFSMDACYDARSYEPYEKLQELLAVSGLYFEECTGWYAAVYKI